jgi:hypothetical protein
MSNEPLLIMGDLEAHLTNNWTRSLVRLPPQKEGVPEKICKESSLSCSYK